MSEKEQANVEQEKQEGQKTVVSFIAGLLIGGLLVWIFGVAPANDNPQKEAIEDDIEEVEDAIKKLQREDNQNDRQEARDDRQEERVLGERIKSIEIGDGTINVINQDAGNSVSLESATFPTEEGWVAVRTYQNEELGSILGAVRFSKENGIAPDEVVLLTPTRPGKDYAVVFFADDGDRKFNPANDGQINGTIAVFQAQ